MNYSNRLYGTLEKVKLTQLIHNLSTTSVQEEGLWKEQRKCTGKNLQRRASLKEPEFSRPWTYSGGSLRYCHNSNGNNVPSSLGLRNERSLTKVNTVKTEAAIGSVAPRHSNNTQNLVWLPKKAPSQSDKSTVSSIDSKSPETFHINKSEKFQKTDIPTAESNTNASAGPLRKSPACSNLNKSSTSEDSFVRHKAKLEDATIHHKYEPSGRINSHPPNAASSNLLDKSTIEMKPKNLGRSEDLDVSRNKPSGEPVDKLQNCKNSSHDVKCVREKGSMPETLKEINKLEENFIWPPLYSVKADDVQILTQQTTNLKNKIDTYSKNIVLKKNIETPAFSMGRVFNVMRKNVPNIKQTNPKSKLKKFDKPNSATSKLTSTIKPKFSMTAPTQKEKDKALAPLKKESDISRVSKVDSVVCNPKYFVIQEYLDENKAKLRSSIRRFIENKKKELTTNMKDEIEDWKKNSAFQRRIDETKARLRKSMFERASAIQSTKNKGGMVKKKKLQTPKIASIPIKKGILQHNDNLNTQKINANKNSDPKTESIDVTKIMTKKYRQIILKSMPEKCNKTFNDIIKERENEKVKEIFDQAVIPVMQKNMETELSLISKEVDDNSKQMAKYLNNFNGHQINSKSETKKSFGSENHDDLEQSRPSKPMNVLDIPISSKKQLLKTPNLNLGNNCSDVKSSYTSYPSGCLKKPELLLVSNPKSEAIVSSKINETDKHPSIYIPLRAKNSTQPVKPETINSKKKSEQALLKKSEEETPKRQEISEDSLNNVSKLSKSNNDKTLLFDGNPLLGKGSVVPLIINVFNNNQGSNDCKTQSTASGDQTQQLLKSSKEQATTSNIDHLQKNQNAQTIGYTENGKAKSSGIPTCQEYAYNFQSGEIIATNGINPKNETDSRPEQHYKSPLDEDYNLQLEKTTEGSIRTSLEKVNTSKVNQSRENKCIDSKENKEVDISTEVSMLNPKNEFVIHNTPTSKEESSRMFAKEVPAIEQLNESSTKSQNVKNEISKNPGLFEKYVNIFASKENPLPPPKSPLLSSSDKERSQRTHALNTSTSESKQENPAFTRTISIQKPTSSVTKTYQKVEDSPQQVKNTIEKIVATQPNKFIPEVESEKYPKESFSVNRDSNIKTERTNFAKNDDLAKQQSESLSTNSHFYNPLPSSITGTQEEAEPRRAVKLKMQEANIANKETNKNEMDRNFSDSALHSISNTSRFLFDNTKQVSNKKNEEYDKSMLKTGFSRFVSGIINITKNIKDNIISKSRSILDNNHLNIRNRDSSFCEQLSSEQPVGFLEVIRDENQNNVIGTENFKTQFSVRPHITRTKRSSERFEETVEFSPLNDSVSNRSANGNKSYFNDRSDIGVNRSTTRQIVEEKLRQYPRNGKMEIDKTFEKLLKTRIPKTILKRQTSNIIKEEHETINALQYDILSKNADTINGAEKDQIMRNSSHETNQENIGFTSFNLGSKLASAKEGLGQNIPNEQPSSSTKTLKILDSEELVKAREDFNKRNILGNRTVPKDPLLEALKNLCNQFDGAFRNCRPKNLSFSAKPHLLPESKSHWEKSGLVHGWNSSKSTTADLPFSNSFREFRTERSPNEKESKINFTQQKIQLKDDKFEKDFEKISSNPRKFTFPRRCKNKRMNSKQKVLQLKGMPIKKKSKKSNLFSNFFATNDDIFGLIRWDESTNQKEIPNPESFWNGESKDYDSEEVLSYIRRKT